MKLWSIFKSISITLLMTTNINQIEIDYLYISFSRVFCLLDFTFWLGHFYDHSRKNLEDRLERKYFILFFFLGYKSCSTKRKPKKSFKVCKNMTQLSWKRVRLYHATPHVHYDALFTNYDLTLHYLRMTTKLSTNCYLYIYISNLFLFGQKSNKPCSSKKGKNEIKDSFIITFLEVMLKIYRKGVYMNYS